MDAFRMYVYLNGKRIWISHAGTYSHTMKFVKIFGNREQLYENRIRL